MPSNCTLFKIDELESKIIPVSDETLDRLRIDAVVCLDQVYERDFKNLLFELKEMKVGHTWKKYPILDIGNYYNIQTQENKKRDTKFFFYYAIKNGEPDFLGTATVASKINHDFKHDGFPVISRCFILKKYRENRFYAPILKHRIKFCEDTFGKELKAIHMGTSNIRVLKATLNDSLLDFKFIGCENLDCGSYKELVYDFLKFSPDYLEQLLSTTMKIDSRLHDFISQIVNLEFSSNKFLNFKALVDEAKGDSPIIGEFADLIEAIGVIQSDEVSSDKLLAKVKFDSRAS